MHNPKAIKDYLDIIIGIVGIFLGTFIISLYFTTDLHQHDIGFVLLIASLIYLLLRNKFKKTTFTPLKINHRVRLLLNITFFIIFSITLLIWHMQLYCRPPSYFILISLLAGIIAIEILYFKEGDSVWLILSKILLLSANIRAGIFYNFSSIMGADAYWHAKIAQLITNTGFLPPLEISKGYSSYPISHLFISITKIVCQIDIKDALFCSIGLVSIISTIFIYYIGKKLAGPQVGLLATLLINVTGFIITKGVLNFNPGSLVLCYFVLILYLIFKEKHKVINGSLIIFITLLMVITHQLSTFVVFISLTSICLSKYAYKCIYKHKGSVDVNIAYILVFATALQSYWMYAYVSPSQTFIDTVLGPLVKVLESGTEFGNEAVITQAVQYSMLTRIFFHIPYLILLFFAIGGALLWLSSKNDKKFSVVTVVIVLYIFVYGIPVFAIKNMLPGRWLAPLSVFLVILASAYIFKPISLIKSNPNKVLAIFTIIFIFSFFNINTAPPSIDNPLCIKEGFFRSQFKNSEIYAVTTINNIYNGTIKTDTPYLSGIFRQIAIKSIEEGFDIDYVTHSTQEEKGTMSILRRCTLKEPVSIAGSKIQPLPKEFFDRFESTDYDLTYKNGEVSGYLSRG
jgi:hypothetical protein